MSSQQDEVIIGISVEDPTRIVIGLDSHEYGLFYITVCMADAKAIRDCLGKHIIEVSKGLSS